MQWKINKRLHYSHWSEANYNTYIRLLVHSWNCSTITTTEELYTTDLSNPVTIKWVTKYNTQFLQRQCLHTPKPYSVCMLQRPTQVSQISTMFLWIQEQLTPKQIHVVRFLQWKFPNLCSDRIHIPAMQSNSGKQERSAGGEIRDGYSTNKWSWTNCKPGKAVK